jgi:hypothetical protein
LWAHQNHLAVNQLHPLPVEKTQFRHAIILRLTELATLNANGFRFALNRNHLGHLRLKFAAGNLRNACQPTFVAKGGKEKFVAAKSLGVVALKMPFNLACWKG